MAEKTRPVTTPTASSATPTKDTAISVNPDVVKTILDILGNLPSGDFFYNLITFLQDKDSGLDLKTYTDIIEALENVKFTNISEDILTPFLFDILEGDANLPFNNADADDHLYLVVVETLYSLAGTEQHYRLRCAILSYIINTTDNDDQKGLLQMIVDNL